MEDLSAFTAKPRLRVLLDHFSRIEDLRQSWKTTYPLRSSVPGCLCDDRQL